MPELRELKPLDLLAPGKKAFEEDNLTTFQHLQAESALWWALGSAESSSPLSRRVKDVVCDIQMHSMSEAMREKRGGISVVWSFTRFSLGFS